jgi:hypothetical protein
MRKTRLWAARGRFCEAGGPLASILTHRKRLDDARLNGATQTNDASCSSLMMCLEGTYKVKEGVSAKEIAIMLRFIKSQ